MTRDQLIFSEMIKSTSQIQTQDHYSKKSVILSEPQTTDSRVRINNMPNDSLIIKVDHFESPNKIFNGNNDECKRADFVIICFKDKIIIFIEMKKKSACMKHVVKQLLGADCFINYCQNVGRSFWNHEEFLDGYDRRYVCISKTQLAKQKTRVTKNSPINNTPENALKIDWPNDLQFNRLIGRLEKQA